MDLIYYPSDGRSGDWAKYYKTNPTNFNGTEEQKSKVLGGEGAYWSEFVDTTGIVPQTFVRLSSIAERLWSLQEDTEDIDEAWVRLDKFRCILINRGIPADAFAVPSSCASEWKSNYQPPF